MYKFEISADSPAELQERMLDFAKETLKPSMRHIADSTGLVAANPEYVDDVEDAPIAQVPAFPETIAVFTRDVPAAPLVVPTQLGRPDLDVKGMPWDARIHSANKSKIGDGGWKYRRGVDDALVAQVEKELMVAKTGAAPIEIPLVPPTTIHAEIPKFVEPVVTLTPVAVEPVAPAPVYENIATPTTPMRPAHSLQTFKTNMMELIAKFINEGKIDQAWVNSMKQHFEVKEVWNILASEKQCIELYETFGKYELITMVD